MLAGGSAVLSGLPGRLDGALAGAGLGDFAIQRYGDFVQHPREAVEAGRASAANTVRIGNAEVRPMTTPRVNLLPHREARRERQKKVFWFMTGLSVVAGRLMIAVVWTVLQGYISNQESRNEFIRAENRKLDTQIKEIIAGRD